MLPPENIHAVKKMLSDCCGRVKPSLKKLAVLLGIPDPPKVYVTARGVSIFPTMGVQSFSVYAIEQLGLREAYLADPREGQPTEALSRLLDTLAVKR